VLLDGTTTSGIYGKEKATMSLSGGRMAKLPSLILGCSTFEVGGSVDSNDGVFTLGNNDISFGVDGGDDLDRGTYGGGDPDGGRWRQRRCGQRQTEAATRMKATTQMEARMATKAATRMEAQTEEATEVAT
jgi:hypothetical protein